VKRIPPGSGLGGGSADAAAVLRWAGENDPELAARLGADVPFCLSGGRAAVSGVGELVEELAPLELGVVLVVPALGVSTAAVYSGFDEVGPSDDDGAQNDLERAALEVEPRLKRYRDLLAGIGGKRPQLAGSGSTWFLECGGDDNGELAAAVRGAVCDEGLAAVVVAARADG
jgi:4-diphosphocytidyl-2-C-methyl-D-erythritol kinase